MCGESYTVVRDVAVESNFMEGKDPYVTIKIQKFDSNISLNVPTVCGHKV